MRGRLHDGGYTKAVTLQVQLAVCCARDVLDAQLRAFGRPCSAQLMCCTRCTLRSTLSSDQALWSLAG
jgi:hypothetical protein